MNKIFTFLLLFSFGGLTAQDPLQGYSPETVRKGIIYKREWSIGAALHTNGFYFSYHKGKIKNYYTTNLFHVDLGYLDHPKTTKVAVPFSQSSKPFNSYTYGRANSLINLRFGKSQIRYFSEKARHKGIAIGMKWEGGINIGLLKPYYLFISRSQDGVKANEAIKYSAETANAFLGSYPETDAAPFWIGLDEIKIIPGFHGRISVRLDPGAFEAWVKALDIGLQVDAFLKRPQILVETKSPYVFLNFFAKLELGKRSK